MASEVEIYMGQGETFNYTITLTNDVTGGAINIANYQIRSTMRRSYYSQNASANIVCSIADAANGNISLTLAASNTSNIKAGRYVFDVETEDTSNVVSRILQGYIYVTPEVSK